MTRCFATFSTVNRVASGATDFEAYLSGASHDELSRAAGTVIDRDLPTAPEHADTISRMTDHFDIAGRQGPQPSRPAGFASRGKFCFCVLRDRSLRGL